MWAFRAKGMAGMRMQDAERTWSLSGNCSQQLTQHPRVKRCPIVIGEEGGKEGEKKGRKGGEREGGRRDRKEGWKEERKDGKQGRKEGR